MNNLQKGLIFFLCCVMGVAFMNTQRTGLEEEEDAAGMLTKPKHIVHHQSAKTQRGLHRKKGADGRLAPEASTSPPLPTMAAMPTTQVSRSKGHKGASKGAAATVARMEVEGKTTVEQPITPPPSWSAPVPSLEDEDVAMAIVEEAEGSNEAGNEAGSEDAGEQMGRTSADRQGQSEGRHAGENPMEGTESAAAAGRGAGEGSDALQDRLKADLELLTSSDSLPSTGKARAGRDSAESPPPDAPPYVVKKAKEIVLSGRWAMGDEEDDEPAVEEPAAAKPSQEPSQDPPHAKPGNATMADGVEEIEEEEEGDLKEDETLKLAQRIQGEVASEEENEVGGELSLFSRGRYKKFDAATGVARVDKRGPRTTEILHLQRQEELLAQQSDNQWQRSQLELLRQDRAAAAAANASSWENQAAESGKDSSSNFTVAPTPAFEGAATVATPSRSTFTSASGWVTGESRQRKRKQQQQQQREQSDLFLAEDIKDDLEDTVNDTTASTLGDASDQDDADSPAQVAFLSNLEAFAVSERERQAIDAVVAIQDVEPKLYSKHGKHKAKAHVHFDSLLPLQQLPSPPPPLPSIATIKAAQTPSSLLGLDLWEEDHIPHRSARTDQDHAAAADLPKLTPPVLRKTVHSGTRASKASSPPPLLPSPPTKEPPPEPPAKSPPPPVPTIRKVHIGGVGHS
ncbi:hypothetical protein CYMTET_56830 [Cymbomonas tetramitiformis]|uniref:Uncharacterized protein n=1 Tax=Cymbomonas tetramitiformis TaxID=36881 RepID=A0AAE0BAI0_9CHLO|nr:hypothetical protein CYMTET_56830 [Cymbomonas tetramitiformis]